AYALVQRLAANGAGLVEQLRLRDLAVYRHRAAELAFRIARTAHERTEPARLQDQVTLVTQRAYLVRVRWHRLLGIREHLLQRRVEVADDRHPLLAALLDLVETLLEGRRVVVV